VVYARGYGFRDLTKREPVDPNTIFRFGSVSKQFTAAALLMLQQDGKLSLAEPLATWFPRVTSASDVRLEDVLSQVSGYRDYYPLDYVDLEMSRPASEASIAKEYGRLPLTAEPRTRWEYSNTNYLFAGLVAERVSGSSLGTLLALRIFAPLGMTRTLYDEPYRPTVFTHGKRTAVLFATPAGKISELFLVF
jgi:CubicO group peptidase (beta-lactamase class C family)